MSDAHAHHITPLKIYYSVAAALLLFTSITVIVAQFDFGPWNMVVAMAVAGFKALLVALFFMHLYYDNKLYMIVFCSSLLFLAIFIILTMYDTETRGRIYHQKEHPIQAEAIIYRTTTPTTPMALHAADSSALEDIDTTGAVDASDAEDDDEEWGVE